MLNNQSLTPVAANGRALDFADFAALWGSLGVGLLVMLAGAALLPALSMGQAFAAIAAGTLFGALLLGAVGYLGAKTGLSSAGLIWQSLGSKLAFLPILLNILQLIGWALFEIIIMRDGLALVLKGQGYEISPLVLTLGVGALLVALLSLAMTGFVRKFIRGIGLSLMLLALVWLTVQLVLKGNAAGWAGLFDKAGDGSMSFAAGVDLVIALPISWLPLIADYTRFGRSPARAFAGSTLGYAVANGWCFALGVVLSVLNGADMMAGIALLPLGLGALLLILIDEMDNGYSDLYSASVSGHSLAPQLPVRALGPILAIFATALAIIVKVDNFADFQTKYVDFLYLIGAVFVPLFGVVLAHFSGAANQIVRPVMWGGAVAWVIGVVLYEALGGFSSLHNITGFVPPELLKPVADFGAAWGASLPSLIVAFVMAWGLRKIVRG